MEGALQIPLAGLPVPPAAGQVHERLGLDRRDVVARPPQHLVRALPAQMTAVGDQLHQVRLQGLVHGMAPSLADALRIYI